MTNMLSIDIQIDDRFDGMFDPTLIERVAAAVLQAEGITDAVELSVLVTDDAELHRLNREYRNMDRPTDVLSFANEEEAEDAPVAFVRPPEEPRLLGDLAISYERVLAQAEEYGHSTDRELAYLTAHGVLHLLGYDHERGPQDAAAMREREEAAMTRIGLSKTEG